MQEFFPRWTCKINDMTYLAFVLLKSNKKYVRKSAASYISIGKFFRKLIFYSIWDIGSKNAHFVKVCCEIEFKSDLTLSKRFQVAVSICIDQFEISI